MSSRFILNEFSYFGRGSRVELVPEIQKRGFKKVLVVTDAALLECGVAEKVTSLLENAKIKFDLEIINQFLKKSEEKSGINFGISGTINLWMI